MSGNSKVQKAIQRATDPGLRADNWAYIIDVCDLVKADAEERGVYALRVIEEQLNKQDANVILRSLSLIVALAENCGSRLQQGISSKHFTDVLYELLEDRDVHIEVKKEIVKVVHQLADTFKKDPSLKYMHDLEKRIRSSNPSLVGQPFVPKKTEMSSASKAKEEKELEEALKLSLLEYETNNRLSKQEDRTPEASRNTADSQNERQQQKQQQPTIIRKVRAMYDLNASEQDELSFKKGDLITVVEQVYRDWWRGTLRGKVGIFPLNYVTPVTEPTQQELAAEMQKEDQVFSQKDNVDRLQQKLREAGNVDVTQDQEINDLYGTVSPLRPQLSKMLGKYAQKKKDMVSLRQILANAEVTYNQMLSRAANAYAAPVPPSVPSQSQYTPNFAASSGYSQPQPTATSYQYQNAPVNGAPNNGYKSPQDMHPISQPQYQQAPPQYSTNAQNSQFQQYQKPQSQQLHPAQSDGRSFQTHGFSQQTPPTPYPMSSQNTGL